MSTAAQIEANRRNAKRSTGPKSDEGKVRSALNALKYGIYSNLVLLPDEDEAELEALRRSARQRFRPADDIEAICVERFVMAWWKVQRLLAAEQARYRDCSKASSYCQSAASTAQISVSCRTPCQR